MSAAEPAPAPAPAPAHVEFVQAQRRRIVEEGLEVLTDEQGRALRRYAEMDPIGTLARAMTAAIQDSAEADALRAAREVIRARSSFDGEPDTSLDAHRDPACVAEHRLFRRAEREACPMNLLDRTATAGQNFRSEPAIAEDLENSLLQRKAVTTGEHWPPPNWMTHLHRTPGVPLPLHRCRTGTRWEELADAAIVEQIRAECQRFPEFNALLTYMLNIDRHAGYMGPRCTLPDDANDGFRTSCTTACIGLSLKVDTAFRALQGVLDAYGVLNERPGPPVPEAALREMYDATRDLRATVEERDNATLTRVKLSTLQTLAMDSPEIFLNPLLHEHVHPDVLMGCANLYASRECQRDNYLMVKHANGARTENELRTLEELGARPTGWAQRPLGTDVLAPDRDLANIRIHIDMLKRRWLAFMLDRVIPKWEPKTSSAHDSFLRRYLPVMRRLIYAMAFLGSDTTQMVENEMRSKGWVDMVSIFLRADEHELDRRIRAMPAEEFLDEEASKIGLDIDVTHIVAAQPGFFVFLCECLEHPADATLQISPAVRVGMHLLTRVARHTLEGIVEADAADGAEPRSAIGKRKHAWYLRRYPTLDGWLKHYEDALGHHRRSARVRKATTQARRVRKAAQPYARSERPDSSHGGRLFVERVSPAGAPTTEFLGARY